MKLPQLPTMAELPRLTPTLYAAMLKCRAKAIWLQSSVAREIPENPFGILGQCFHGVLEASKKPVNGDLDQIRAQLRKAFDDKASNALSHSHPFTKSKFTHFSELPFYFLRRERAVQLALKNVIVSTNAPTIVQGPLKNLLEKPMTSKDALLQGRPDLIDKEAKEVVDYKTGDPHKLDADTLSDDERLQLMFYACLAVDNGIDVDQGVIVRADGKRVTLPYDAAEIAEFGKTARKALQELNNDVKAGKTFTNLTSPSPTNCSNCPCMPVCDVFWMNADSSWQTDCGANFEGVIEEADEANSQLYGEVVTLKMTKCSGTVDATTVSMANIPRDWLTDSPSAIALGQKIRIIKARLEQDDEHAELKFDKAATTCWLI